MVHVPREAATVASQVGAAGWKHRKWHHEQGFHQSVATEYIIFCGLDCVRAEPAKMMP